mmetsp:Transcript_33249/g.50879  ORF Transcript_33249/g.50879 Transcript_33249/m.50879 type:complete len:215 (-) Transcript_33249:235-879(-)
MLVSSSEVGSTNTWSVRKQALGQKSRHSDVGAQPMPVKSTNFLLTRNPGTPRELKAWSGSAVISTTTLSIPLSASREQVSNPIESISFILTFVKVWGASNELMGMWDEVKPMAVVWSPQPVDAGEKFTNSTSRRVVPVAVPVQSNWSCRVAWSLRPVMESVGEWQGARVVMLLVLVRPTNLVPLNTMLSALRLTAPVILLSATKPPSKINNCVL